MRAVNIGVPGAGHLTPKGSLLFMRQHPRFLQCNAPMMTIGSIQWPADATEACRFYLKFLIEVVEGMRFTFPEVGPNPIATAKAFVEGKLSEDEYRSQASLWWEHLDSSGAIRETRDHSALTARLAICLLSATRDQADQLGEHLSCFLEVLGFLGVDLARSIRKMEEYFGAGPQSPRS